MFPAPEEAPSPLETWVVEKDGLGGETWKRLKSARETIFLSAEKRGERPFHFLYL